MGVIVDCTPKCHYKLAREGIEYSWGGTKNCYWTLHIRLKKSKELFKESVRKCLDQETAAVLTKEQIRAFSPRAYQYTIAYYALQLNQENTQQEQLLDHDNRPPSHCKQLSAAKIESMFKEFKTHQSAIDFDSQLLNL
jgi:hypothetical protein